MAEQEIRDVREVSAAERNDADVRVPVTHPTRGQGWLAIALSKIALLTDISNWAKVGNMDTIPPEKIHASSAGVDQQARDDAAAAGRIAVAAGDAATANTNFLSTFVARVTAVINTVVPAWALMRDPPEGEGIPDGSITNAKLADDAADQRVIATDSVGPRELAPNSVRDGHIADNAVISRTIPSNAILTRHIAEDQVTRGEMAANSVGDTELVDGGVIMSKLSAAIQALLGRVLPVFPAEGSRNDKILKFNQNALGWEDDTGASPGGGTDQQARDDIADEITARQNADTALGLRIDDKQDTLTQTQLLGFLQFDVVPGTIIGYTTDDLTVDWRLWVSGGDTVGDVWVEVLLEGQAMFAASQSPPPDTARTRHKLSATNIYNYTLQTAQRDNLVASRASRRQGRDIEVDLRFYDAAMGGNVIDIVTIAVDWVASPGDVRRIASQTAVPAQSDRFFFTDENQAGDPLRYVEGASLGRFLPQFNVIRNIASYDAAQNRFEDSSGNPVVVHDGAIVQIAEAVYDAAVADAGFTPNATALFIFTS